jgi:hypothetical protein
VSARLVPLMAGAHMFVAIEFDDGRRWAAERYLPKYAEPYPCPPLVIRRKEVPGVYKLDVTPNDPNRGLFFVRPETFDRALAENGLQPVWRRSSSCAPVDDWEPPYDA